MEPGNQSQESTDTPSWEHDLISKIALAAIDEQRRARRWGIFFKSLMFVYLFFILGLFFTTGSLGGKISSGEHTALIDVQGMIAENSQASADSVVGGLRSAFEDDNTKAVILRINSPGGSPVQSGYINDEITRLRSKYPSIPVYAVITDLCASGGYYVAAAAQEIYADKASLIGSIGAVFEGFGFSGSLQKLGIERRVLTAGERKAFLDPFQPLQPLDSAHMKTLLKDIHQQFINVVRSGRGDRLNNDEKLFTGLIWTGEQGLDMGLIDALGSSSYVAREIVGVEKVVDFTQRENYLDRLAGRLGTAVMEAISYRLR